MEARREAQRKILASQERKRAYTWGLRGYAAIGLGIVVLLAAGALGWTFALVPILVAGSIATLVCITGYLWHLIASFRVRVPGEDSES